MTSDSVYVFSASAAGRKHLLRGEANEDAAGHSSAPVPVIAVADGHSDDHCPRSADGSAIAVKTAIRCLTEFVQALPEEETVCATASEQFPALAHRIIDAWTEQVTAHYLQNLPEKTCDLAEGEIPVLYGTTLLAAAVFGRYLLVLQQGDGFALMLHRNGALDCPIPPDPNCDRERGGSSSLCDSDAANSMRFCLHDLQADPLVAFAIMSDGLEGMRYGGPLLCQPLTVILSAMAEKDREAFEQWLPGFLPSYDQNDGQDDRSIAGFADTALLKDYLPYLKAYARMVRIRTAGEEKLGSESQILRNLQVALDRRAAAVTGGDDELAAETEADVQYLRHEHDELRLFRSRYEQDLADAQRQCNDLLLQAKQCRGEKDNSPEPPPGAEQSGRRENRRSWSFWPIRLKRKER